MAMQKEAPLPNKRESDAGIETHVLTVDTKTPAKEAVIARGSRHSHGTVLSSAGQSVSTPRKSAWSFANVTPRVSDSSGMRDRCSFKAGAEDEGYYDDQMRHENIGIAFCIRAESDVGANLRMRSDLQEENIKHLQGLEQLFSRSDTLQSINFEGPRRDVNESESFLRRDVPFQESHPVIQFLFEALSCSAIGTFVYIMAHLALAPACVWTTSTRVANVIHTINAVLYAVVSLALRGCCSRIDVSRGVEVTQLGGLLRIHLRSPGMWLDIVAIGGLMAELVEYFRPPHRGMYSGAQLVMLLQLLKMWRFFLTEGMSLAQGGRGFLTGLLKLFFRLCIFGHAYGCVLIMLANYETHYLGQQSWIVANSAAEGSCWELYVESLYFAVIGITSVGYGDILVTSLELACNAVFLVVGQLFAAKVCADLTWLTSMYNQHEATIHEHRRQTLVALQRMQVPRVLRTRVLAYQNYVNKMHKDNLDQLTLRGLSSNLMRELRLCSYRSLVIQAPFLRQQPMEVISLIVNALYDSVYLPSDFIVRAGERGRELFFVKRGEVSAYIGPSPPVWGLTREVATMKVGNYFGELAMLTGHPRGSFVMAKSYTICSVLPFSAVEELVENYPEAFTTLVKTMTKMYNLRPKVTWAEASERLCLRHGFRTHREVFDWFLQFQDPCESGSDLTARTFDKALKSQKINDLERRVYWSDLDNDVSGGISFEELARTFTLVDWSARKHRSSINEAPKPTLLRSMSSTILQSGSSNGSEPSPSGLSSDAYCISIASRLEALLEENRRVLQEIRQANPVAR
eukprot:TRINITY_DN31587_c0_g1_i1.p1 TRINITY_DN31587_c0_g1~~TRINITY_DN31587_c0_g1_i1.p1  ORF type:complete len:799 (-),score=174.01 TRINITY_DN31587_c0_g1_i1:202-2598(-)